MIDDLLQKKKEQALDKKLGDLVNLAHVSFEELNANPRLIKKTEKRAGVKLAPSEYQISLNSKSNIKVSKESISLNSEIVYRQSNLMLPPEVYKNDSWVDPVRKFVASYRVEKKLDEKEKAEQDKKKEEELEYAKKEQEKKNFGLEYDKKAVAMLERRIGLQSVKEGGLALLQLLVLIIGFLVTIAVFIIARWWGLLIVPLIVLPIFSSIMSAVSKNDVKESPRATERYTIAKERDTSWKSDDSGYEYDDDVKVLAEDYGVDEDEAEKMQELMDDWGVTEDEAYELKDEF